MKQHHLFSTHNLTFAAMMAALTAVGSAIRITIPIDIAGTTAFHLGNIMCALSGILLGPWLGGLAAGLGSAIFDILSSYVADCWITFLTKGVYGMVAGLVIWAGRQKTGYLWNVCASVAGAVSYAVLYLSKAYFYDGLFIHALTSDAALLTVVSKLPATIFNAAVAIICAPLLAAAIYKALSRTELLPKL